MSRTLRQALVSSRSTGRTGRVLEPYPDGKWRVEWDPDGWTTVVPESDLIVLTKPPSREDLRRRRRKAVPSSVRAKRPKRRYGRRPRPSKHVLYWVIATSPGGGSDGFDVTTKRDAIASARRLHRDGWIVKIEKCVYRGDSDEAISRELISWTV